MRSRSGCAGCSGCLVSASDHGHELARAWKSRSCTCCNSARLPRDQRSRGGDARTAAHWRADLVARDRASCIPDRLSAPTVAAVHPPPASSGHGKWGRCFVRRRSDCRLRVRGRYGLGVVRRADAATGLARKCLRHPGPRGTDGLSSPSAAGDGFNASTPVRIALVSPIEMPSVPT